VEEHGLGELVAGLALVEPALDEVPMLAALQEVQREQRPLCAFR
jgi:hypothetical protein